MSVILQISRPACAPRLLDQIRQKIRVKHYSIRTDEAYVDWARRFVVWHEQKHHVVIDSSERSNDESNDKSNDSPMRCVYGAVRAERWFSVRALQPLYLREELPGVSHATNPPLSLRRCMHDWRDIAAKLREPPRKRRYQCEGQGT